MQYPQHRAMLNGSKAENKTEQVKLVCQQIWSECKKKSRKCGRIHTVKAEKKSFLHEIYHAILEACVLPFEPEWFRQGRLSWQAILGSIPATRRPVPSNWPLCEGIVMSARIMQSQWTYMGYDRDYNAPLVGACCIETRHIYERHEIGETRRCNGRSACWVFPSS